jgi:hypothetical protein
MLRLSQHCGQLGISCANSLRFVQVSQPNESETSQTFIAFSVHRLEEKSWVTIDEMVERNRRCGVHKKKSLDFVDWTPPQ